ncbi:MAG: AAA family ATPase [Treponema sp.]|nr:AAA family ATPase [Treponema sp.]
MAERSLRIEAFRNIGFKDGKPWHERLVLNNSLKKGELGDLLILIGANNSGKSNVLDALDIFGNDNIRERDVTDLPFDDDCKKPTLTLFSRKDGDKEDEFALTLEKGKNEYSIFPEQLREDFVFEREWKERKKRERKEFFRNPSAFLNSPNRLIDFMESTSEDSISIDEEAEDFKVEDFIDKKFEEIHDHEFFSKIIRYTDKPISRKDLNLDSKILKNPYIDEYNRRADAPNSRYCFFEKLCHSVGVDIGTVKDAYKKYEETTDRGKLRRIDNEIRELEDSINEKLQSITSKKFNTLFHIKDGDSPYSFKVFLDRDGLGLSFSRGDNIVDLDYQSAGFRWFFNIFFNLLNTTELNAGDIIIMDEPAMNLHVKGQRELRAFLKEFAIQNDITIIVATHSPFLIDLDYLDELRVVVNDGTVSHIVNNFAAVDPNDPDSLLPIKDALTVENHILVDPDEKIVFVEGITDYNYLTAFKKLFGKTGITFLPINGVGEDAEECKGISKKLIRIRKHNPILLVDNDKAGQQMKNVNKESELEVIALSDIDSNFKTIESLFSQKDLNTFGLLDENGKFVKHASTSTVFKNMILKNKDSISDDTKANFRKVFDWFVDEA